MDRRNFLASLGIGIATVAVPNGEVSDPPIKTTKLPPMAKMVRRKRLADEYPLNFHSLAEITERVRTEVRKRPEFGNWTEDDIGRLANDVFRGGGTDWAVSLIPQYLDDEIANASGPEDLSHYPTSV